MRLELIQRINGRLLRPMGLQLERTRPTRRTLEAARPRRAIPIDEVEDLPFRIAGWTYTVPVSQLVGRPVFGYGPHSWHPLAAASAEILQNPDIAYEDSILRRFYHTFAPATIAEAHCLSEPGPLNNVSAFSLFEPWSVSPPPLDDPLADHPRLGSPLFGPLTDDAGRAEMRRLKSVIRSVLKYGYQPRLFPRGEIKVTVLRSKAGERYLVRHGQHRASVLAAMDTTTIEVGIHGSLLPIVDEAEVDSWPYVKSGFITRGIALEFFHQYFAPPERDPALAIAKTIHQSLATGAHVRS